MCPHLRTQNTALQLKFLHKFYNHDDLPWVHLTWRCRYANRVPPHVRKSVDSFWWKDIMFLADNFFMIASCKVQQGNSVRFWCDLWDLGVLQ